MRTIIDHEVMFLLDDNEGEVVPQGRTGYIHITGITVHLGEKRATVWAGGYRCRKDGQLGIGWGKTCTSVELPDPDKWIDKAKGIIYQRPLTT